MEVLAAVSPHPPAPTTANNNNNSPSPKSPEPESETPTRIQPPKPLSFTNGVLKRHHHLRPPPPPATVAYKECLKNHAASLGGHALDGCGEFMPSPNTTPTDPTSLKCAACGCHRNFHRREPEDNPNTHNPLAIEYHPHHRHHPPPPAPLSAAPPRSPNSASPPPISSSYYPSAPHMLLALSGSGPGENPNPSSSRKRFRSRFTQHQKERMHEFAERVGWKMQKSDEDLVLEFCNEVKVDKGVLKVWMHNNKNTFAKTRVSGSSNNTNNSLDHHHSAAASAGGVGNNGDGLNHGNNYHHRLFESDNVGGANGSSSSS
ncbi:unnamed protein product [Linum tenue]|uniref:ZF-HD dimerization-type domain-containing protein n=1 Tax=Linum tenue TaxID=586396 RepID=A0AAV0N493_9ROSI|nr:unnamed protein product [Linum tenue]